MKELEKNDCYFDEHDKESVTRFLSLLIKVENRICVSRPKPMSTQLDSVGKGMIDKLILQLENSINREHIEQSCRDLNIPLEGKYLKDKRFYLTVETYNFKLQCLLGKPENQDIRRVIINPSKSGNVFEVGDFLIPIFGEDILNADIKRLDFTVDVTTEYKKVLEGLDVKNKRANVEYLNNSVRSGILIGTSYDKILVYNKAKQLKLKTPLTRIERQLTGKKVPIRKMSELRSSLDQILKLNPLGIVTLNNLDIVDLSEWVTNLQRDRYHEFKTLIKHEGYFLTRKKLNTNDNFERDYKKFYSLTPWEIQPQDIFNNFINQYYKKEK